MPAAGYAAESGESDSVRDLVRGPGPDPQALQAQQQPHIYVLGPSERDPRHACSPSCASTGRSPASEPRTRRRTRSRSRSTATRRALSGSRARTSPAASAGRCAAPVTATPCSTPADPLDAAAAAALSTSGSYGPQLLSTIAVRAPAVRPELLPGLRDPRLYAGRPDRRGLQPRLGDRRPDHDLGRGPGRRWTASWRWCRRTRMSQAEHPDRLRPGREVTVDDVRAADGRLHPPFRVAAARADPRADPWSARRSSRPGSRASARSPG